MKRNAPSHGIDVGTDAEAQTEIGYTSINMHGRSRLHAMTNRLISMKVVIQVTLVIAILILLAINSYHAITRAVLQLGNNRGQPIGTFLVRTTWDDNDDNQIADRNENESKHGDGAVAKQESSQGKLVVAQPHVDLSCFSEKEKVVDDSANYLQPSKYHDMCRAGFHRSHVNISSTRYTIVCNSYRRLGFLKGSIQHYTKCPNVDQYIVVWSDVEMEPPEVEIASWSSSDVPVRVERHQKNSLNNRFAPIPSLRTDAVLSIDDDVIVSCDDIEMAFQVWRDAPHRMVGFTPRAVSCRNSKTYDYHSDKPLEKVKLFGYRMILTKFAFFHRKYLDLYHSAMPDSILNRVDEYMNCEDIAFAFLVGHRTGQSGIYIQARMGGLKADNAISAKRGHGKERDLCLGYFKQQLGLDYLPLPLSYTKIEACSRI